MGRIKFRKHKQIRYDRIAELENEIKGLKEKYKKQYEEKFAKAKDGNSRRYSNLYKRSMTRLKANIHNKIDRNTREKVNKNIDRAIVLKSKYMDGVMAYPIISRFGKDNKLNQFEMPILILLNIIRSLQPIEAIKYGYPRGVAEKNMLSLTNKGLVELFDDNGRKTYTIGLKGINMFKEFKKYYAVKMKELVENKSYKIRGQKWKITT